MSETTQFDAPTLPIGIRSRLVRGINGLDMHMLEAGHEERGRPLILLLHGFPELAFSWRKVMLPLAAAGYHVVAPDQRGFGRTTGWDPDYDGDLAAFRLLNVARDAFGLVSALGYRSVAAVVGHDFGSPVAAWCALLRPDVFHSVALMSSPFAGPPSLPFDSASEDRARHLRTVPPEPDIHEALAALDPPRKHYQWFYSTRAANADMHDCPQGVHDFLRAYYHYKSADWSGNTPFRLQSRTAAEIAKMPTYYIMDLDKGMAETVRPEMPPPASIAACRWLPESELSVYSGEFGRTGFQGGLQWYRCRTEGIDTTEQQLFFGKTIDVPSIFVAGKSDWGTYQTPGAVERMQESVCTDMRGVHLIDGAGHWVQQEQPEKVVELLLAFLNGQ